MRCCKWDCLFGSIIREKQLQIKREPNSSLTSKEEEDLEQ